jgi:integrase
VVKVELRGLHKLNIKGRKYYYAWRGGPRVEGEPGTPAFLAAYNKAIEEHRAPDTGRFRSLVVSYKASNDFKGLAKSTAQSWTPWLDRISDYFGDLSIAQFERPEKIRPIIRQWRNQWIEKPRTADLGLQVLSRVLSYGVDPLGKLAGNPCERIKRLYSSDRSAIIWTESDIVQFKAVCRPEFAWAIDLATHTGLRLGDLVRLSWSHIKEHTIEISTGKSKHRQTAIIPLYDDLRAVLASIPRRSTAILTNSFGRPWAGRGFCSQFSLLKIKLLPDRDLHFHDLRGTAATRFYNAGLPIRVIAEILGWTEDSVEGIIHKYVDRTAATRAIIRQLNENKPG